MSKRTELAELLDEVKRFVDSIQMCCSDTHRPAVAAIAGQIDMRLMKAHSILEDIKEVSLNKTICKGADGKEGQL